MPLPLIDSVILSGSTWISARLSVESRWTLNLDEAKHLQELYRREGHSVPPGATVMRQVHTPEPGVELLASPIRASSRDPSQPVIRMKRGRDGRIIMRPKRKRKRIPPQG